MQLGIGLGRMGANMVRRLLKGGHQCGGLGSGWSNSRRDPN
jgi:6-phosphogluconate dehydrogenase (decarboxylating)